MTEVVLDRGVRALKGNRIASQAFFRKPQTQAIRFRLCRFRKLPLDAVDLCTAESRCPVSNSASFDAAMTGAVTSRPLCQGSRSMSRRMNVCVWSVLVALAVSTLCDFAEAGGRRRRARYCQPTCCQPQPVCCAPAPRGPEYFCAWYLAYRFGSIGYYYSPHCQPSEHPSMSPVMIAANYDPEFVYGSHCHDTDGPFCVSDGYHTMVAPGLSPSDMRDKHKTMPHKCTKLKTKLPSDHAGPEYPDDLFEVHRVGAKPGESDSGFYFVEFQAQKHNYLAKCAVHGLF